MHLLNLDTQSLCVRIICNVIIYCMCAVSYKELMMMLVELLVDIYSKRVYGFFHSREVCGRNRGRFGLALSSSL